MGEGHGRTIDGYLAVLHSELRLPRRRADRVAAEVSDHLHDAAETRVAEGTARTRAEAHAIARFGDPAELARGVEPGGRILFEETVRTGVLTVLGTWVAAAAGASGVLTQLSHGLLRTVYLVLALGPVLYLPLGVALRFEERRRRLTARPVPGWLSAWNGTGWELAPRALGAVGLLVFVVEPPLLHRPQLPDSVEKALFLGMVVLAVAALPVAVAVRARRHGGRRMLVTARRVRRSGLVAAGIAVAGAGYAAVGLSRGTTFWGPLLDAGTAAFLFALTLTGLDFLRLPHADPRQRHEHPRPYAGGLPRRVATTVAVSVTGLAMAAAALFTLVPSGLAVAMAALDDYDEDAAVTMTSCRATSATEVTAAFTIVNRDDEPHRHVFEVFVRDDGERVALREDHELLGAVTVPAGRTRTLTLTGVAERPLPADFRCEIMGVDTPGMW